MHALHFLSWGWGPASLHQEIFIIIWPTAALLIQATTSTELSDIFSVLRSRCSVCDDLLWLLFLFLFFSYYLGPLGMLKAWEADLEH